MHGLMEIKKLNARTAKPMQNTYGGQPTNPPHTPVDHQDRIESAIDQKPDSPFMIFWRHLNVERGEDVGYGVARNLFDGGKAPDGTLVRYHNGDGLRAVPAPPYDGRRAWHGEYRERTGKGTKWHRVLNGNDAPIIYTDPDYAMNAAERERMARIEQAFR